MNSLYLFATAWVQTIILLNMFLYQLAHDSTNKKITFSDWHIDTDTCCVWWQSVKASKYETDDSVALLVCLFGVNQDTCAYNLLSKAGSGMPSWSQSQSSVRDASLCPQPVKASTYETADSVAPLVENKCCLLESKCKIKYDLLHYLERIKILVHRNYRGRRSALCHLAVSI